MSNLNRRSFLKKSALAVGGASAFVHPILSGTSASGQVVGANNRVRVAVAGAGSRGGDLISTFRNLADVEVAYVVDADGERLDPRVRQIAEATGTTPKGTVDFRVMLEDKDIDCVVIASTNHWHALQTIWACQAGKDVFVEKPGSQNLFEGRKTVEAAAKYNRVVQLGTQRRGEANWARCVAAAKSGKYGRLTAVKVYCNRPRGPFGFRPIETPPEHLDWNQWLGPAPMQPYHANFIPHMWHWFWDTGNGEIGNNGPHYFDLCLWAIGERHPNSVITFGSRFVRDARNHYRDQMETPTVHFALYDFGGIPVIFESCNIGPGDRWCTREETEFYTEDGIIREDRGDRTVKFFPNGGGEAQPVDVEFERPAGSIFANFINAIRDRDSVPLNAPIAKGFYCAAACHWANAAYRTGYRETFSTIRENMGNNPILQESIEKFVTSFKGMFEDRVSVNDVPFQISEKLVIDTEREQFVNSRLGNSFLTRVPREPFAVPEQV